MTPIPAALHGIPGLCERQTAVHPGLRLDKPLKVPEGQEDARPNVAAVVLAMRECGDNHRQHYNALLERRGKLLDQQGAVPWQLRTVSPMALHLARATSLENAAVCLHRTYGFAYLPGSGLKGMARAYAETVWLPNQHDKAKAWELVEDVFGWADNKERREAMKDPDHPAHERPASSKDPVKDCSGAVVFHDAWPVTWPELEEDILACHHGNYYGDQGAPGDWENPNLVSFLTIKPYQEFSFALSTARPAPGRDELVHQAMKWLTNALVHLGAGAKTNAGYGRFEATPQSDIPLDKPAPLSFKATLELVSPAFLAGANQGLEDCQLRGATLRGQLRWWWRTMHAAHLGRQQLLLLETAIWGNASIGGAVSLSIQENSSNEAPLLFERSRFRPSIDDTKQEEISFRNANLPKGSNSRLTNPRKVTTGLQYLSYGMNEGGGRPTRHFMDAGSKWAITLKAREALVVARGEKRQDALERKAPKIPREDVLREAICALWLLTNFGGVGSKSRNGFGSLQMVPDEGHEGLVTSLKQCRESAAKTREPLRAKDPRHFGQKASTPTPRLEDLIQFESAMESPWQDPFLTLHQVGYSISLFAASQAHNAEKKALGLPRRIRRPENGRFRPRPPVTDRHASPWHLSLQKRSDGRLSIRYTAFPAHFLPDERVSRLWLEALKEHLMADLPKRFQQFANARLSFPGQRAPRRTAASKSSSTPNVPEKIKVSFGLSSTRQLHPAGFFHPNREASKDEKKAIDFLNWLKDNEGAPEYQFVISQYATELQIHDPGRWKKIKKDPILKPVYQYLREHHKKP